MPSRPRLFQARSRFGFTLIELLVVVGIIAVLIAILLPTLSRAKDTAKTTRCLANLHSIGNATASYSTDWEGMLYPCYYNAYRDSAGNNVPARSLEWILDSVLRQYNWQSRNQERAPIYYCPSAISGIVQYPQTLGCNMGAHARTPIVHSNTSFGYIPLVKIQNISRPHDIISMSDVSQTSGALTNAGWITGTGIATRWSSGPGSTVVSPGTGGDEHSWVTLAQADNLIPINNSDATPSDYHLRYRHNNNTVVNAVMLDGHAEPLKVKSVRGKQFGTAY